MDYCAPARLAPSLVANGSSPPLDVRLAVAVNPRCR
jgi:hypothetical protein